MSYSQDIAQTLVETISKTAGLPTFQLAGHIPNLSFWIREVKHARDVVAGYSERYSKLVEAQAAFDAACPEVAKERAHHEYDYQPPRLALTGAQSERLLRELNLTANRLIDRCLKETLINIETADDLRALLS